MPYFATIHPNRIVKRYVAHDGSWEERYWDRKEKSIKKSIQNLSIKKRSFSLSNQTRAKIRDTVQMLHELSAPRTVFVSSKKSIYNFRSSFITLTLPSKQVHSDLAIKKCLNNFLVRLRQTYGLKNYFWKAELQDNENIHFHLVVDQFIPHQAVRYYWNLAINTLGYVDRYREKMSKLNLQEYAVLRNKSVAESLQSFQRGNQENWKNPPTEQVVAVLSKQLLAKYLSKYLSKNPSKIEARNDKSVLKEKVNIATIIRVRKFGRVWARSQSLSKIKIVTRWAWDDVVQLIKRYDDINKIFKRVVYDYCEILYINNKLIGNKLGKIFHRIIRDIGISYNYPFPVV